MKIVQIVDYQTFGDDFLDIAKSCADHADTIWFRIKGLDGSLIYEEAKRLRLALPNADLVLSDRADIAAMLGYDGVQLGAFTMPTDAVKYTYPQLKVGYSAHSIEEIKTVNADYYTLSPLFFTKKDYEVKPLGVVDVSGLGKEVYGLGGISSDNVSEVKEKGYTGIAGISFHKCISDLRSLA
jgi:thiamine-phosphate pyrophosphorylase